MSEFKVNVVFSNFFLKILHCPPLPSSLLCLECPDLFLNMQTLCSENYATKKNNEGYSYKRLAPTSIMYISIFPTELKWTLYLNKMNFFQNYQFRPPFFL